MRWLALLILFAALAAAAMVKFPEDFSQARVGNVLALYAPQEVCPVIEVREVHSEMGKMLADLLGITPNFTNPKAAYYIAATLRAAAEAAGGRVYMVGVLSHSPPAGFVAASPLNVTEFARQVGGVKAVVIVLPWNITELDVSVEVKLLRELEKHPEWKKAYEYMQKAMFEKARAFRSWLMGNDSALGAMDLKRIRDGVRSLRGELDNETLRLAVRRLVEARLGKPLEKASDKELADVLPYFVWAPVLMPESAAARDAYFGIPAVRFAAIKGSNMSIDGVREALLNAVKILNCTPSVIYVGEMDLPLFTHDVLMYADNVLMNADLPDRRGEQDAAPANNINTTWLPIAITVAAAVILMIIKRATLGSVGEPHSAAA
jgi:hypothetical protein